MIERQRDCIYVTMRNGTVDFRIRSLLCSFQVGRSSKMNLQMFVNCLEIGLVNLISHSLSLRSLLICRVNYVCGRFSTHFITFFRVGLPAYNLAMVFCSYIFSLESLEHLMSNFDVLFKRFTCKRKQLCKIFYHD